jgi:hypothetical protein
VSTALIPVAPSSREAPALHAPGPRADFIAHLIAAALRTPQTRARRRAEPEAAAYCALGQWPTTAGRLLSRAL